MTKLLDSDFSDVFKTFLTCYIVECHAMPGSSRSDSWCEIHCQGGKHPACMNSSGVHQQCICGTKCALLSFH